MLARPSAALAAAALLVTSAGCNRYVDRMGDDAAPDAGTGELVVSPVALDFGAVEALQTASATVTLANAGDGELTIGAFSVEGGATFGWSEEHTTRVLAPGTETELSLFFEPQLAGGQIATLAIHSDEPGDGVDEVELRGDCLAPMIELDPVEWDFVDHEVGCEQEREIAIRNAGTAPLVLTELVFTPTSDELQLSFHFPVGTTLAPHQEQLATVHYEPRDELPDTGYLHVYSSDPWTPDAVATQAGAAHYAGEVVDEYDAEVSGTLDVLWVVDDTGSMAPHVAGIEAAIAGPWTDLLVALGADYHQEVILAGTEQLLEYGLAMLTPPMTSPGGPMDGFLREDAGLFVIIVSDEDDQSSQTVAHYVAQLQALEPDPEMLLLSAVSGGASGCDSGNVSAMPAPRLVDAANTTGGIDASLCGDWATQLTGLFWLPWTTAEDTYELSEDPVEGTVEVTIDGVPMYVGWYYDDSLNAIVFEQAYVPLDGDEIAIRYQRLGSC